jgi:hypothetical protein
MGGGSAAAVGTGIGAEDGPQRRHVQAGAGPVRRQVEDPLHLRPAGEDQVPAVLDLVDREPVAEAGPLLFPGVQGEAQAGAVDPPLADLAQPPYSRMLRQGICAPGQARRVGDRGEAVAVLGEGYSRLARLAGHVLVAVEHDLRAERRVPGHLDRHVPPVRVDDVEGIVVDVLGTLFQAGDYPGR